MRTYIIAGVFATVCVFAYLGLSRPAETQQPSLNSAEKSALTKEVKAKPSTKGEEVVQESKSVYTEPAVEPASVVQVAPEPVIKKLEPTACQIAREALNTVGADPVAEKVWLETINNLDNPPNERKDLIEDLNTTGFKNHRNPTPEDVSLIQSRLALIEKHSTSAADPVNAAAFQEAKKDLTKMLKKATVQVQPATQPVAPAQPTPPIQ
jgi:hypothetical protein